MKAVIPVPVMLETTTLAFSAWPTPKAALHTIDVDEIQKFDEQTDPPSCTYCSETGLSLFDPKLLPERDIRALPVVGALDMDTNEIEGAS